MNTSRKKLFEAAENEIISEQQAQQLYDFLMQGEQEKVSFNFTHVLYYFGGLLAIGAMTIFMNLAWENFGGKGLVLLSIAYAVIGLILTHSFKNQALTIPAGITSVFVVCLTPLAIFGLQKWLGIWPDSSHYQDYHKLVKWHWFYMELATLLVGSIMIWKYRFPFLVMPIAVTLWYFSMDVASMLYADDFNWGIRKQVSLFFGLAMIALAFWVDLRNRSRFDYPFWIYLFGVLAFWGGLSMMHSDSELSKFLYCCVNVLMIGIGVLLVRRVFVIFGALGCCGYLLHLADHLFKDSWLFPIALSAIGLGIVYLGILWQKHEHAFTQKMRGHLPLSLQKLLQSKDT